MDTCHMHTDLMCATGFKLTGNISIIAKPLQDPVVCHCISAIFLIDTHFLPVNRMASDRRIHSTGILFNITVYNCMINPLNAMLF